jgi:Spy/CpxP family protein refolding chaperone
VKRVWLLVLAASVGLNAALLWQRLAPPRAPERPPWSERVADGGPGRGPRGERGSERRGGEPMTYAEMQERRLERMAERLDLDTAQIERLRAIAFARGAEMDSLRTAAREERGRIRDLLGAAELDADAVREASQRLRGIDARIEARITDNLILEAGVLEPEQRRAYLEMMRFAGPRGGRRGR